MAEGGGDHVLAAGADDHAGGGVLAAGLDGVLLDPLQGGADGAVVGFDDALVAAREGEQGDGLGSGEGEVAAGAVGDVAEPVAAAEAAPAGYAALEDGLEGSGIDGAGKAEGGGAPADPSTSAAAPDRCRSPSAESCGLAVVWIAASMAAVTFVVGDAVDGGEDLADRGDHRGRRCPARRGTWNLQ